MTATLSQAAPAEAPAEALPRFERGGVGLVVAAFVALELAVAARYGMHRDELYFLACARHLAWGYVDQPPLVPAVAWVVDAVAGPSAAALRVLPALAGGASIAIAALTARELGGRRVAQLVAALAAAVSPELLAAFHLLSTAAFDTFFWSVLAWLWIRLNRTGDRRLLLVAGVVTGVALLDKLNVALLVAALVVCTLAGRRRRLLWSWQAACGALLAVALAGPDLAAWNATHGWAQLAMLRSLHQENSGLGASLAFVPSQLVVVGPFLAPLAVAGLVRLLRMPAGQAVGQAYLVLLTVFAVSGGKSYYIAGLSYALFAGGGVALERRLVSRRSQASAGEARRLPRWVPVVALASLLTALPLALPVLPASSLPRSSWEGQINKDLSATVGWPSFVRQLAGVADRLPPAERRRLVVFTGDYGAAGAVDLYGSQYGLPRAISGHNNYWWWGPGDAPAHSVTIAVNLSASYLRTIFGRVRLVGTVATPGGVWTEERGDQIFLCTDQLESWQRAWPGARHYG